MGNTMPTLEEQAAYYDKWNEQSRSAKIADLPDEIRLLASRVLQWLGSLNLDHPELLEVGCGTGWFTEKLAEFGQCTAIDLSASAIRIAKQRNLEATFISGDFLQFNLPPNLFDLVVSMEAIAYFTDQAAFVEKVASLLKPRGHLIVTTHNRFVYERRSEIPPAQAGQVRNWLSCSELRNLLKARFDVLHLETILPAGDKGLLRLVNSVKVNTLLQIFFSERRLTRAKEHMGWGHSIIAVARRRD